MFAHPSAQEVSVDAVRQRQFRHRNTGLQTGFDQLLLGLRVVAASAIPLATYHQPLLQFSHLLCHKCPPCSTWTHLSPTTVSGKVRSLLSAYD